MCPFHSAGAENILITTTILKCLEIFCCMVNWTSSRFLIWIHEVCICSEEISNLPTYICWLDCALVSVNNAYSLLWLIEFFKEYFWLENMLFVLCLLRNYSGPISYTLLNVFMSFSSCYLVKKKSFFHLQTAVDWSKFWIYSRLQAVNAEEFKTYGTRPGSFTVHHWISKHCSDVVVWVVRSEKMLRDKL